MNKNKTTLYVSPSVAELLQTVDADIIKDLEKRFDKKMTIRAVDRFHQERYEIG